ncbi:MAG TPA: hypothetical protein VNZ67_09320, partial [bacterium]|nr:hypothetical protein [bacterium]
PLFDLALMIVIRTRKGIPPWKGSPDHVPLRLRALGWEVPRVALTLCLCTLGLGGLVYAVSFAGLHYALLLWAGLAVAAMMLAAWFMSIRMPEHASKKPGSLAPSRKKPRA